MLALSKKFCYATEAVLYIAYNSGAEPISSKEIAEKQELPPRYLEQMMQRLVRGGILRGMRGPKGGYVLARERRRITLQDVCDALEDEADNNVNCAVTNLGKATLDLLWHKIHANTTKMLTETTIADLCDNALERGVRRRDEERTDFAI